MAGSEYTEQGRVEVFYDGEWGLIVVGYFSYDTQITSCRLMGYATASTNFFTQDYFESGTGRIIIDSLYCSGNEKRLSECGTFGLADNSSQISAYDDDAGVVCIPYGKYSGGSRRRRNKYPPPPQKEKRKKNKID